MNDESCLTYADLARVFTRPAGAEQLVGLELECALVNPRTGRSVEYDGVRGSRSLIASVMNEMDGQPLTDAGFLVGTQLPGGAQLSLELGGALEYSSTPFRSLAELVRTTRRDVTTVAGIAKQANMALLPGGLVPFTPVAQIPWAPKPRVAIMRQYFRRLGAVASSAEAVMGLTLSTQTTLDYLSEADLLEKLNVLVKAAPIASALFVNSPLENGAPSSVLSRRMQMWRRVDPDRCGVLSFATRPDLAVHHIVDWAASLPMIYRSGHEGHVPAPHRSFAELLRSGFDDGSMPVLSDWASHLSQVWPQVRPRWTLELRASDGLCWRAFAAAPAFWVGLTYHDESRRSALALLDGVTAAELDRATADIASSGLAASVGHRSVGALAQELLRLARVGLAARVAERLEPPEVVHLLDPLAEVVRTGVTFAERYLRDWNGPLGRRPEALVQAYRV